MTPDELRELIAKCNDKSVVWPLIRSRDLAGLASLALAAKASWDEAGVFCATVGDVDCHIARSDTLTQDLDAAIAAVFGSDDGE